MPTQTTYYSKELYEKIQNDVDTNIFPSVSKTVGERLNFSYFFNDLLHIYLKDKSHFMILELRKKAEEILKENQNPEKFEIRLNQEEYA